MNFMLQEEQKKLFDGIFPSLIEYTHKDTVLEFLTRNKIDTKVE